MSKQPSFFTKKGNLLPLLLILGGLLVAFSAPIYSLISPATLDVQIMPAPAIMPSVYKVYANDEALEGKYSLFKMVLKNNSSHTATNVEVEYEIPNYIEKTVCRKIAKILPGQTVVVNCYPKFPDKIVEKTTSSKEEVTINVKGSNIKDIENSFSIPFKGRNEFIYSYIPADEIRTAAENFDNKELLNCLVTPEDPIIKYLTQKIQEKILKGEMASVVQKEEEGVRFMLGVYEAMLRSHMVYSGTTGVPEKLGDVNTITQSIRLPREVVTGKTGLCIELSLLYASVMMCAGLDPIIYLVPGHAYPGFRMNNRYYAIESTGIGGEGIGGITSGQDAYKQGMKSLEKFFQQAQMGDPAYMVLDVREAIKEGAIAMELKDDTYLRQKIDEIAQSFEGGSVASNVSTGGAGSQVSGGGGGNDGGGGDGGNSGGGGGGATIPSGYKAYNGAVSFAFPKSWAKYQRDQYYMNECIAAYGTSDHKRYVEIYEFPGASNANQAIQAIKNHVQRVGASMGYRITSEKIGDENGFSLYRGETGNQNMMHRWVAAFKNVSGGVAGIAVGSEASLNTQATATKIFNSLR